MSHLQRPKRAFATMRKVRSGEADQYQGRNNDGQAGNRSHPLIAGEQTTYSHHLITLESNRPGHRFHRQTSDRLGHHGAITDYASGILIGQPL
ncbi:MAG: hypothetical protein WD627_02250, partial [Actinomycetota bacterium]